MTSRSGLANLLWDHGPLGAAVASLVYALLALELSPQVAWALGALAIVAIVAGLIALVRLIGGFR